MALWKITPKDKKSCVEKQVWTKGKKKIIYEIGYRWGEVTVRSDKKPKYTRGENVFDMDVEDWEFSDGCWDNYDYENMTGKEIERLEEFLSENSMSDLADKGWVEFDDNNVVIFCDVKIEKVKEEK
jgi:hypothetical protein